jgi:hypothetical protein
LTQTFKPGDICIVIDDRNGNKYGPLEYKHRYYSLLLGKRVKILGEGTFPTYNIRSLEVPSPLTTAYPWRLKLATIEDPDVDTDF